MNKIFKSEAYLFFIAIILYMFVINLDFPPIIYLGYSTLLALYFFPVKVIIKIKTEKLLSLIGSSYTIAWFLTYSNIVFYYPENIFLQMFMLLMSFVNLFFLYYFYKKKNDSMALHLLAFAFIPMIMM